MGRVLNYESSKWNMDKDQWIVVNSAIVPTWMWIEDCTELGKKAKSIIRLSLSDLISLSMSRETTMKTLWNKLRSFY